MKRILALLGLMLLALPAAAQSPGAAPPNGVPSMIIAAPAAAEAALTRVTAGHAAALGAGMFAGAMAGSALINGGALAALIGAAAGLTIGHWYWTERHDDND